MKKKQEHSAGGPVFKKLQATSNKPQEIVWLLGKHSGYHKWVLPKGMIEEGETPEETAVRETEEELAVVAKIINPDPIHEDHYTYQAEYKQQETSDKKQDEPVRRVQTYQEDKKFDSSQKQTYLVEKTVTFYLMEYVSGDPKDHGWEMEDAGWFSYKEAMEKLSFDGEKEALRRASQQVDNES